MKKSTKLAALVAGLALAGTVAGCSTPATVAAYNLSQDAENFQIMRRVVFFNGITDKYLLSVEGLCSVETGDSSLSGSLEVTCKTGPDTYIKDFLGLSDNVSYFVEQIEDANIDTYHYKVFFRPEEIVPDIEFQTSNGE